MSPRYRGAALAVVALSLLPAPLFAYIGPGSGLSAIGALLAVVAGIFFAVFGFVWYPVKRIMRSMKGRSDAPVTIGQESLPPGD